MLERAAAAFPARRPAVAACAGAAAAGKGGRLGRLWLRTVQRGVRAGYRCVMSDTDLRLLVRAHAQVIRMALACVAEVRGPHSESGRAVGLVETRRLSGRRWVTNSDLLQEVAPVGLCACT